MNKFSVQGDLSKQRMEEARKASRKLKAGKAETASSYLPYRPEPMQGDTGGLSVREKPKDQVG